MTKTKLTALAIMLSVLVGCNDTVKTVVVDQNGKVIEEKSNKLDRFIKVGEAYKSMDSNYDIVKDSETGCKYIRSKHMLSPLYDKEGKVEGCGKP